MCVLGEHPLDLSFRSRYCKERIIARSPRESGYLGFLMHVLKSRDIDILIPVGQLSTIEIAKNKDKLDSLTHVELPKIESVLIAADKKKTYDLAEELGVPYPQTTYPRSLDEMEEVSKDVTYPAVVKPLNEGIANAFYPRSRQDLLEVYRATCKRYSICKDSLPMIQEYIPANSTHSFSALYQRGLCKRVFMWNEIRSFPPTGGISTYSESVHDSDLKEYGMRLLDRLDWHGVAQIEFKLDKRNGQFKLMEINPRFWASTEIAVQSGVDFPYLLCKMADGERLEYSESYRHVKFHWLSRELEHIVTRPGSIPRVIADTLHREVKSNFEMRDFRPHIFEFTVNLIRRSRLAKWISRSPRFPQVL